MSQQVQLVAINNYFFANYSSTPVAYENSNFSTKGILEYVKITPIFADSEQVTQGASNNRYRNKGVLSIQIFTELDKGGLRSSELRDEISTIWQGLNLNGLVFKSPDSIIVGHTKNGFYQTNILVDFYFDTFS